jgi:hypothetical protein
MFLASKWPEKGPVKSSNPLSKGAKTSITTVGFRFGEDVLRDGENAHAK